MRKIFYLGLERYKERYTEMLARWSIARFEKNGFDVVEVLPLNKEDSEGLNTIETGKVLDAHKRCSFATAQMSELCKLLTTSTSDDIIYFEDVFTPGLEAVPYILEQMDESRRPKVYARNHAQSVDVDDFTFPMRKWMRRFELLADHVVDGWFVASTIHKESMQACMFESPVHVVGLPFDIHDVCRITDNEGAPKRNRPKKVVYASRLDSEKQPRFLAEIIDRANDWRPDIEFVICTGSDDIRSDDEYAMSLLRQLEEKGDVVIKRGLSKQDYYRELQSARVLLNTARQDFISNTAIEASVFGTMTVAPCFRAFPETLGQERRSLYVPFSLDDAMKVLIAAVDKPLPFERASVLANEQDKTLDRISSIMKGNHVNLGN